MADLAHAPAAGDLLRLLLEQAQDHALILLDPRGTVVGWLAGAEHVLGYTADEMVGRPVARLFTPEDRDRGVDAHELAVARADGRSEDDRWMVRRDGSRFWASGVVTPLRDLGGAVVGYGKVLRDRTDVRAQVEALAQAGRRKDLFLGTVAHELRNPLGPLANVAQAVRLGPYGDALAGLAQVIERQVGAIRRLVDDLLDVTRIGAGKVRLDRRRLDLNEVLARAADGCRPQAERRGHDFKALLLPSPIVVDADPDRLHQVFANLLTNAVKYTPDGGSIWLKSTVEGGEAVVRVEDAGVGIEPDMLPRIFDLFTQEEASAGRSDGGLGLGLPLVRELVGLHGGTVQVLSQGRGKGSEFAVRLPLARPGGQPAPGPG